MPDEAEEQQVQPRGLRVLLASNFNPVSTSTYFARAFRRAHDVLTVGPSFHPAQTPGYADVLRSMTFIRPGSAERYVELIARRTQPADLPVPFAPSREPNVVPAERILDRLPAGWKPDLFVWLDCHTDFLPVSLAALGCPTACIVGDTHTGAHEWRVHYARQFHHVFVTFNRQHLPLFQPGLIHWLPAACDPEIHGGRPAPKRYDVGFAGSTYPGWYDDRVGLLRKLNAAGIDVFADCRLLEEMTLVHRRSRLVFNKSLAGDLNMRVFESLASGSLLLTDRLVPEAGLALLFQDREHLVLYTPDDLVDLARYYLAHPDEREAVAERGRAEVLAKHTYAHRADAIVEAIFGRLTAGIARCASQPEGASTTDKVEASPGRQDR